MPLPVTFLKSAVHVVDYPKAERPEIALAGRSNSGKSSFLNALTRSKIAKVSQEPGKTRLLNFFDVGAHYRIVDMPGYGFAARGGEEIKQWTDMVETYLSTRDSLVGLILVIDIRRDWEPDEQQLLEFMNMVGRPTLVVLTKADRCSRQEIIDRATIIKKQSHLNEVWPISNSKLTNIEEVEEHFFSQWIKPKLKGGRK